MIVRRKYFADPKSYTLGTAAETHAQNVYVPETGALREYLDNNEASQASRDGVPTVVAPGKEEEYLADQAAAAAAKAEKAQKAEAMKKAGLVAGGIAAVGAAGYGAYRAWKKKKKAAKAEAEKKFKK